jgi:hypothetical protein
VRTDTNTKFSQSFYKLIVVHWLADLDQPCDHLPQASMDFPPVESQNSIPGKWQQHINQFTSLSLLVEELQQKEF